MDASLAAMTAASPTWISAFVPGSWSYEAAVRTSPENFRKATPRATAQEKRKAGRHRSDQNLDITAQFLRISAKYTNLERTIQTQREAEPTKMPKVRGGDQGTHPTTQTLR